MALKAWVARDARDVDGAREEIFRFLEDTRVIYCHGWIGMGASAILRSIAEVLPFRRTTPELCFDRIINIDCPEWKSRRDLQRIIAKELKLDSSVMAILDKVDEDDDFEGVDESSRSEVPMVTRKINEILRNIRFMVIFHNGSDEEINLYHFGVPPFDQVTDNRMVWTFRRKFLTLKTHEDEVDSKLKHTKVLVHTPARRLYSQKFYALVCQEAAIMVSSHLCMRGIDPAVLADCCLYKLFVHHYFQRTRKSNWISLASNSWICDDGIMQEDRAWEISNALCREIRWEIGPKTNFFQDSEEIIKPHLFWVIEDDHHPNETRSRISVTSGNLRTGDMQPIPPEILSFVLAFEGSDSLLAIPNGLFGHAKSLSVIVLSCCAFSFASPPFLRSHVLRFIGLDHCKDNKTRAEEFTDWTGLGSLWVLDLQYTNWDEILSKEKMDLMTNLRELNIEGVRCWQYTSQLQGRIPDLRRLRITKPVPTGESDSKTSTATSNSFLNKTKLEILDLSCNCDMEILPNSLSKAWSLQVLVLDGCNGLENIALPDGLPHLLRSFSYDGYGPASQCTPTVELPAKHFRPSTPADLKGANISKISLEGCMQLENLFLRGLPNLIELDLSGTAIKILDFESMVVEVPKLKRLFLLGCERLCAIRMAKSATFYFPKSDSEVQPNLELVCVDTRAGIRSPRPLRPTEVNSGSFRLQVHAFIADARLARSLCNMTSNHSLKDVYFNIHLTSWSVDSGEVGASGKEVIAVHSGQVSLQNFLPASAGIYSDVLCMIGDAPAPMDAFPQPPAARVDRRIRIAQGSRNVESEMRFPGFLRSNLDGLITCAESLHLHHVSSSTMALHQSWSLLRICRVESCPKLDTVFNSKASKFERLEIFWVSDLLSAHSVITIGGSSYRNWKSFQYLQHVHIRSCPRLQFGLPVWGLHSLPSLETIHVIHCGDLKHIFTPDNQGSNPHGVTFPKLTTIHLYNLPVLRQICEVEMVATALENIKIRGCWGLRRLPTVAVASRGRDNKKPTVEIEKDVWDALEWDGGVEADHFEAPIHSRYYKKMLPRVSVLR